MIILKKYCFLFLILLLSSLISACGSKGSRKKISQQQQVLIDGQRQYHLRGCVKCHGYYGKGDGYKVGFLGKDNQPKDFRNLANYKQGSDLSSIKKTIKKGMVNDSNSAMPPYSKLTEEEINIIANYVVYLQTNVQASPKP